MLLKKNNNKKYTIDLLQSLLMSIITLNYQSVCIQDVIFLILNFINLKLYI
jgi:hypothetical protein